MKTCIYCNAEMSETARFCPKCGKENTPEAPPPAEDTAPSEQTDPAGQTASAQQPPEKKGSGRHTGLLAGVLISGTLFVLSVIVLIVGILITDFTPLSTASPGRSSFTPTETTTQALPTVPFTLGEITDEGYENEWADLRIPLAEGYLLMDEAEYERFNVSADSQTQTLVFGMYSKEMSGSHIRSLVLLDLVEFADHVTLADGKGQIDGVLQSYVSEYGGSIAYSSALLGGQSFAVGKYAYEKEGETFYLNEYVRQIGQRLIHLEIIGDSFESNDSVAALVEPFAQTEATEAEPAGQTEAAVSAP